MRCNKAVVFLALFIFTISAAGQLQQAPKPMDLADEPFHSPILENDYLKVYRPKIPRFKQTLLQNHAKDFVRIVIGDGTASFAKARNSPMTTEISDGSTQSVSGGFSLTVKNDDTTLTFRAIEVELRPRSVYAGSAYDYASATSNLSASIPLPVDPKASYRVEHNANSVLGAEVQLLEGDATSIQVSHPQFIISPTDVELKDEKEGEPAAEVSISPGNVAWFTAAGPHKLKNVGKGPARYITLEML